MEIARGAPPYGQVDSAGRFLEEHGREIDKARFQFHFNGGSVDAMMEALAGYQNEDGGFGHGLEVDVQAPQSNPFAMQLVLLICWQANIRPDHPLLGRAVDYLERTQDADGGWRFAPEIYQHPLAPWFEAWEWPSINPSCSIAGLLRQLGLGSERLHAGVRTLFDSQADPAHLLGDGFYNVLPYAYYFMPEDNEPGRVTYMSGVLWWLIRQHTEAKLADASHFFEFVRTLDSYTGQNMPSTILDAELDRLAAEQEGDGGWPSPYSGDWRGWTTVQSLLVLQSFGRV